MKTDDGALARFLRNNRWVLLLFLAGAALLLLPTRRPEESQTESVFTREEERLCAALECMDGVGPVRVLLAGGEGKSGFTGAVIVCRGASDPEARLHIVETVSAFTGLGSNRIVVQKMIS